MRLRIPITTVAVLAAGAVPAASTQAASISTDRGCYPVGHKVTLTGTGFAPSRAYVVTLDDVYFGLSGTDSTGAFSVTFGPGGLVANYAQLVDTLKVTDGTATATTSFTITRPAGARFLATRGNPRTLRAPFEVWGFSPSGARLPLYLHYIGPRGIYKTTVSLGRTGGQCGYLKTKPRRVFPFVPAGGAWTFQVDTHRGYSRHPRGPVARIGVGVA
ncbi:MAG TPA: hypothetical protein VG410_12015 [Solirubrobacteraceae bacterium]|nr:hypothetical protein [Solirubrobacteraceae bacterium]